MLARNKRIPSYHELKPTNVLELRMQQLLSVSQGFVTEFIVADWLLLLECVYKKLAVAHGIPISVTGHKVAGLVHLVSKVLPSVENIIDKGKTSGEWRLLQYSDFDSLRFDRRYGGYPNQQYFLELVGTGISEIKVVESQRLAKGLPI